MAEFDIGSLFGGIGKLADSFFGIYQGSKDRRAQDNAWRIQMQREDNAIRRRVADANAAGIHPLAALGVSGAGSSASLGSVGSIDTHFGEAAQGLGRAVGSAMGKEERSIELEMMEERLKGAKLDNDIKRMRINSEIAGVTQPGTAPPIPGGLTYPFGSSGSGGGAGVDKDGPIKEEKDTRQRLTGFGREWPIINLPDSQTIENRYGDAVEWIYGGGLALADIINNASDLGATGLKRSVPVVKDWSDRFIMPAAKRWATQDDPRGHARAQAKFDAWLNYISKRVSDKIARDQPMRRYYSTRRDY